MNEMELLRELAQETPLPGPAELDAARARLVAAITPDPATYATAVAQTAAAQPGPSAGQPADLLRPAAPKPVLSAVKLMYGAAAVGAALVLGQLPFMGDIRGKAFGHPLTVTPLTVTVVTVAYLVPVALWLGTARAVGQGRNWARMLSTVLFILETLALITGGLALGGPWLDLLDWLTGLAVVWLLWGPASRAFFGPATVRADYAGITLGRQRYPLASRPATFVPWADVEQIILYTGYQDGTPAPWIGIRRREGAPALPSGNEQDPSCPVPGVAAGATRRNKGLRLDRERLAAVTAAVAPGISVVEASARPGPGVAGPGRTASAPQGPD